MPKCQTFRVDDPEVSIPYYEQVVDDDGRVLIWAWGESIVEVHAKILANIAYLNIKKDTTIAKICETDFDIEAEFAKMPQTMIPSETTDKQ